MKFLLFLAALAVLAFFANFLYVILDMYMIAVVFMPMVLPLVTASLAMFLYIGIFHYKDC